MWVIGPQGRLGDLRTLSGDGAPASNGEGRNIRVCCEESAERFRAATRERDRAAMAAGVSLRGEASRHCINLLCGRRAHARNTGQGNEILGKLQFLHRTLFRDLMASTVGYKPQLYCALTTQHPKHFPQ